MGEVSCKNFSSSLEVSLKNTRDANIFESKIIFKISTAAVKFLFFWLLARNSYIKSI